LEESIKFSTLVPGFGATGNAGFTVGWATGRSRTEPRKAGGRLGMFDEVYRRKRNLN